MSRAPRRDRVGRRPGENDVRRIVTGVLAVGVGLAAPAGLAADGAPPTGFPAATLAAWCETAAEASTPPLCRAYLHGFLAGADAVRGYPLPPLGICFAPGAVVPLWVVARVFRAYTALHAVERWPAGLVLYSALKERFPCPP